MKTTIMGMGTEEQFEAMMAATGVTSADVECSDDETEVMGTFNFVFVIDTDKVAIAKIFLQLQEI